MQTSLHGIAKKAKNTPKYRFGNLISLLNEDNLKWCFPQLNRKASPGVDGVDYDMFETDLEGNIRKIVEDLKGNRYRAKLVLRRYIPKAGGKKRPLGIPAVGDKVLQKAVALVLSAIYEEDFLPCSHGYRQGKSPQSAAIELSQDFQRGRYGWVVDADIKGFFDNIDHEWLMKMLELRINDRRFLGLIRKWLKAGILEEDGQVIHPETGTPQGGIVSAILANIYLHHVLDLWVERVVKPRCQGDVNLIRFADDFVCCFQYYNDMVRFNKVLDKRLEKFKLQLSNEKTKSIKFTRFETVDGKRFTFLGFEYHWGLSRTGKPLIMMSTCKKKMDSSLASFRTWIKKVRSVFRTAEIFRRVNQKLRGHWNYYGVSGNGKMLNIFRYEVLKILFKWLNRRSQRRSCNWEGFNEMVKHFNVPYPRITGYWK